MNDATGISSHFKKKRRKSPSNPSSPEQQHQRNPSSEPQLKSPDFSVVGQLEHRSRSTPFINFGIDHSFDCSEVSDDSHEEEASWPVLCHSPEDDDQRKRFCDLFALALRGTPSDRRQLFASVRSGRRGDTDCSRAVNSRGDLEGATSDINNHQLLLEEELLGLCDYSDEEEKAAPVVRENDDHDTEETQKGGDDNYLHQISVGNSDNIAAPGQNVKASVKEEDDSIYFYRNNPTLVKHELVVLVRSQPWATSLTNQNLLLSSTPASADDSVKNFTRRNKRQDKESVKRAAGGGEEGLSTRRARRTETQASSNSNVNSQKLPKRRLHTPYGRSLHQLSVSNIVDSEQAALNDKRPHSGSAIVKVGDETTSSEPPDADAGSASVMEHLRQLVYRRYAGSQAEAVKLSQASYTSADDQQDSLSGSLLSSVPDLSRRYRPALEASQQATSRRTMPALKTDSHQSQNGHTLPTAELAAAVEGSGVKATDDFVWRERPLENDGKKDQFQANDRKPVDIEGSSLPLGDGAEIPNSSVVRQAPPAVLSAGKSLLNAEICSVDMARESETTSAQDVVDAKLNGSQHHEKVPTISASFSNTGNVTNVDVTVKPEALVPSESPKTPKLTVQVPTADLNNNNNNNSNTTINKKVPDSKKAYSKQQQIAQQKVKLQQQRPAKPKSSEVSTKRSSSATPHGATSQKTAVSEKRAPSKSGSSESKKCQKSKTIPSTTGGTGIKGGHGSSGNQQYSVSSFNAASPVCQLNNDVWNSPTHQFNGNSNANNSTSPICSKNHNNNNYLGQESQPVQVAQHQSSSQYWQYEALPGVMQQHIDQFASYSSPQQIVTSALPGGYSNSNSNSMDFASGTSEMGRGVLEQWSGGRSSPVFIRENNVRIAPLYRQHHLHTMDSHTTPTMYSNCSNSSESMDYSQQTTSAHNNAMQQQQQQQQPQQQQQQQQQQQFYQHPSQQQVHHTTNITNGGTHVGYNNGNNYAYGNNSQTNRSVLISQPQPNVISIEEALAQLADEDAAMWHEPSTSDHNIQHPTSAQCSAQNVQISSPNFSDNSERYNLNISSNQITSPAPLSPPAKRNSPLNSSSDEMSSWSTDVKKRALMAACRPADQPPDFPGGEQLRALAQPDGTTAPTTCYGLEVSFPQQVFVVLRNKLNSSAEVLDVNVEPSAARALRALRLPPTMERPSLELVQQRFAAFSNATGLPPLYDYSRPELVTQPKEPRPRRVLALCCAYRLRFPALFFGSTTGIENEQDLHDFVHCAAFSGVFNSWNLDQLNAIRKFKELVPPPPPQYQQCVSQTEAFLVLVAHLRVANVPSGRPPPTLRHVVLAPWAAQEINDSLTALSPAVQASSDALVVFNESRKLNTRTQNVTYCTFFAGVRLLDAAENGTYLTPQQLFDVPVQLSDDGAKVLRKLFSFMYEVYETCGSMDRYAALREARNRLNLDDATFFAVLHARRPVSLIRPRGSYDLSPEHVRRVVLGDGDKSSSRKEAKTPRKSSASSKSESSNTRAIAEESCESILPPGTPGTPTTPGTP
ncbi:uncharacterized protein LOC111252326 isoform X3 [Varroa destructor]|nr:uncharacterized protein LOC111252326 isoform X3 [Varroa destructor]XP_022665734.1 uncharacterized protein LOC111252326 isoform X3 [Varroa destructor]XP_022665735.1 uncharacterized protein LOC111252326 isoform X3 [Varroa destructor]XP_022665736.1 uncharacterized protein LOC111252326 isoform X3 [Varroa destructor]XP_022665737.1 uncharacterized protein LOC111252326 isoform X3 [Varroa destructor]